MSTLKDSGYLLLNLPQGQIEPFDLLMLTKKNRLERLNASLSDMFRPGLTALPQIAQESDLADLDLSEEFSLNVTTKVGFLQGLFQRFKLSAGLSASKEKQNGLLVKLNQPVKKVLNLFKLSEYIEHSAPGEIPSFIAELLNGDNLYIITEVVKAKNFEISDKQSSGGKIGVDVDLNNLATANAGVQTGAADNVSLKYNGEEYQTFAVKAFRIQQHKKDKGKYTLKWVDNDYKRVLEGKIMGELLTFPEPVIAFEHD